MQKIFTKLNEALASAKALLHASRHVAKSDSVALQQHRICAALESSVKERKERNVLFVISASNSLQKSSAIQKKVSNFTFLIWTIQICK